MVEESLNERTMVVKTIKADNGKTTEIRVGREYFVSSDRIKLEEEKILALTNRLSSVTATMDSLRKQYIDEKKKTEELTAKLSQFSDVNSVVLVTTYRGKKISLMRGKIDKIIELSKNNTILNAKIIQEKVFPNYTFSKFKNHMLIPYLTYLQGALTHRDDEIYYIGTAGKGYSKGDFTIKPLDFSLKPTTNENDRDRVWAKFEGKKFSIYPSIAKKIAEKFSSSGITVREEINKFLMKEELYKDKKYANLGHIAKNYLIFLKFFCNGTYGVSITTKTFCIRVIDKKSELWSNFKAKYAQSEKQKPEV